MNSLLAALAWMALWLAFSLLGSSCTVIHHPTAGTFASFGGDTQGLSVTQSGFQVTSNNNSSAVVQGGKLIKDAILWTSLISAGQELLQPSADATGTLIKTINP